MGMGEPLHNVSAVIDALDVLLDPERLKISNRKVTVSTSGLVPAIDRLGQESKASLAISLNASTDETREKIMPVNKKYKIADLVAACKRFPHNPYKRITFEYVLLAGVNDTVADAKRLIKLARDADTKLNLIPYNPLP